LLPELVKSNRNNAEGALDGANRQSRAAFKAMFAKNWLLAGESSSADETEPSGLSFTRTLIRTVPRIVLRAFDETSGTAWCRTSTAPELAGGTTGPDDAAGRFDRGGAAGASGVVSLGGADSFAAGLGSAGLEGATAAFSDTTGAGALETEALCEPDFAVAAGDLGCFREGWAA